MRKDFTFSLCSNVQGFFYSVNKSLLSFFLFTLFICTGLITNAQVLIDPAQGGGFELGTTFPLNNWTLVNGAANPVGWYIGTAAGVQGGINAAFIGPNAATYAGALGNEIIHFYQDVNIPNGLSNIALTFYFKWPVASAASYVKAFYTDNTHTPVAGVLPGAGYTQIYSTTNVAFGSYTLVSYTVPIALQGTTVRFVFTYRNPAAGAVTDAAIDNISLICTPSIVTTPAGYGPFCSTVPNNITINYTSSGGPYTGVWNAWLSDATGSFAAPTVIGSGASPILATIPAGTPTGNGYRVTVMNTIPLTVGSDNGSNISITNGVSTIVGGITGANVLCAGTNGVSYSISPVAGATSYTWSYTGAGVTFTNGTTANPTLDFAAVATSGTLSAVANNFCGASVPVNLAITVNALPGNPGVITGSANPCAPSAGNPYSIAAVGGATSYTWTYSGVGATINSGTTATPTIDFAAGATNGILTVTAFNGACSSPSSSTLAITINTVPAQPSAIAGPNPVCGISAQTYSVTNVAGVIYTWAVPAGWAITGGQGTNSVNVTTGNTGGVQTITVTPSNACGNGTAQTLNVTVNPQGLTIGSPIPAAGFILAGNTNVTVFGFTVTPNACAVSYDLTGTSITTAGTAVATDLSNFRIAYDANGNGIYDGGDVIVGGPLSLPGPLNFAIAGQTGIVTARNYILIADVSVNAADGNTFTGNLAAAGVTSSATVAGSAVGNTQTIEGSVTINTLHPAAGNVLQNTVNNPVAAYQLITGAGSLTPASFVFTTAGAYSAGTDFTNFKLWQNSSNSLAGATLLQTIVAAGNPQTLTFNTGFSALAASSTTYFLITTDVAITGITGDNVNIAADNFANFTFTTAAVIKNGTNPAIASNSQTILGPGIVITQRHPAAGTIYESSTANTIASIEVDVAGLAATPTSLTFTTAGTYTNATDITNFSLYQNSVNNLAGATLIGNIAGTARPQTLTFNSGFSSIPVGTVYFILTADVGTCSTNGNTINIAADNFINLNFVGTVGSTFVVKSGVNPVPASNSQTITDPVVTINSVHPAAGALSQNTTNNIIASYLMGATNMDVVPTSFTFTTGGAYVANTDIVNFQLWINTANNIGGAVSLGTIAVTPASGGTITFSSIPAAAATITAGTSNYFLITADVPVSGINGDNVKIAANAATNVSFTSATGGCVTKGAISMIAGNAQTISGPFVTISTPHPAAGNIVEGSINNMIAVYQLDVSGAAFITPVNVTLTTAGTYIPADLVNFKVYQNTGITLAGATLDQTNAAIPASGGTVTFNSGFQPVPSGVTTYLIITADVAPGGIVGHTVFFTPTPFYNPNLTFISSVGGGVQEIGTNPAALSKTQTIVAPQVAIATQHNPAGNILRGSQNNLLAIYKITATNAPITPSSVTLVTAGSYAGANDIQDFNLYQNNAPSLAGATLTGTVLATGVASGQTIVFNSGFTSITNIAPNNVGYLILVADVAGSATPGDNVWINSVLTPLSTGFSFTSSGPVKITTLTALAQSNTQTIVNKLDAYWSNTTSPANWDNVTNNWSQNTGGPYTSSVWLQNGYGFFEGTAGRINVISPAANILADSLTSNVTNYRIVSSASGNGITMVNPASFTVNTGTTYIGDTTTIIGDSAHIAVLAGSNGLVKRGKGELQLAAPFQAGFTGTIFDNAGELTFGAKNGTTNPKYIPRYILQGNVISVTNATLTLAGEDSFPGTGFGRISTASLMYLTLLRCQGNSVIKLYQTKDNGIEYMRVWPSTDGNQPTPATTVPFEVSGTLALVPGGPFIKGTIGNNYNQQNTLVTGVSKLIGNTTLIGYASSGASLGVSGLHVNFNLGGSGHYIYGVKIAYSNGVIDDNGYSLTFLGQGNSTTDGAELCLNPTSSVMTGNWVVGDAAGTTAGWLVTNTTTSLTRGTVLVNNYSKLALQITSDVDNNITYAPSSITLNGLGPADQRRFPSCLDLGNFSVVSNTTTLPCNIILNTTAGSNFASIGVQVGSGTTTPISFRLKGTVTGAGGLEKVGAGNLILFAQNVSGFFNNYAATSIKAGTITVDAGSNLGSGPLVLNQIQDGAIPTPVIYNTALVLNNPAQTVASLADSWANNSGQSQVITLNGTTFTVNQNVNTTFGNGTGTSVGYITGTGNLTKSGTGILTLTGANTYTGLTQVTAGTLVLNHTGGNTLPMTNRVDIIGGTLQVQTPQTLANVVLSGGALTVNNILTITGAFTYVSGAISGSGSIAYSNGRIIYAGNILQTVNSGVVKEWPLIISPPAGFTINNYSAAGVKLDANKTGLTGADTVNASLDFNGKSVAGTGSFVLNGLRQKGVTANISSVTNVVTNISDMNTVVMGMMVTGTGIPGNTYITYINPLVPNSITLSNTPTATTIGASITMTMRGSLKVSMPDGIADGTAACHVQVTGTKTFNSGVNYIFSTPTAGPQILPAFPTVGILNYNPAFDVTIQVAVPSNLVVLPADLTITDFLSLNSGVFKTAGHILYVTNSSPISIGGLYQTNPASLPAYVTSPYVDGYLQRNVLNGSTYDFPLGGDPVGVNTFYELTTIVDAFNGPTYLTATFNTVGSMLPLPGGGSTNTVINSTGVNAILDYGYWTITPNPAITSGTYTIKLNHRGQAPSFTSSGYMPGDFGVIKRDAGVNSGNWTGCGADASGTPVQNAANLTYGTSIPATQFINGTTITAVRSSVPGFSDFDIGLHPNIILPITLISFDAVKENNNALCIWQTANEMNCKLYAVQVATTTDNYGQLMFRTLGNVSGHGTTSMTQNYQFIDETPNKDGVRYYRIVEEDFDSSTWTSDLKALVFDINVLDLTRLYPNPTTNKLNAELSSPVNQAISLTVSDVLGQHLLGKVEMLSKGMNTLQIDVHQFASGIYFLNFMSPGGGLLIHKEFEVVR